MGGVRVLMVEDNLLNRSLMRAIFEHCGHEVIEAGAVEEGKKQLRRGVPDVVLLDVEIPGGGGEQLLREIRADPALARIPVIAVTALTMPGDRERLLQAGFDGYFSKPINTRTFVGEIEAFIHKNRRSP